MRPRRFPPLRRRLLFSILVIVVLSIWVTFAVGVVLSAGHSNEDNYLLSRLARTFLGIDRVYWIGKPPDTLEIRSSRCSNPSS